ncbi:hypothetical protein CROQUDRAFT_39882 [Cronartium quercuum f. sp. fusiforme G11]|uniref:Uncharacterized protein n=1 Tax=Cronartium quercuum f. sp. fusiforme G11 TaxID=708437 RepID=A0A9P6TG45_9BASI|nr:hypothetical protein CROQUDRAFT_39882 [Cronartium quercuum f. sp. fusiforme G11]
MDNGDDDCFDDDDDDAFYNNAAVLAQLDQVESQFTNSQLVPTPQPPPSKRLKFDHQTSRSLDTRHDQDPMDYDGPAVYVDESGRYHNYKSPEPSQRQGVSSVTDRGPFKSPVPGRPQPIPPAVRASAVAGKSTHPSSRPIRLQAEPVSETRNLSLGIQAQRNATVTNPAHPAQAAASTHLRERPIMQQERQPNLEPRWGSVPKADQISARRPSRKSIDNNPIPLAKSNEVIYNQHMSLGSAQNDAVVDLNSTSKVPPGARATVKPLFRPIDTQDPTPAPTEFEQRLHELHMSKESELERMRAEMEAVKQSLKEANLERTRLRGEVSIVRSTLSSHQSSSLQQIQTLRQNEQMIKARAEAAEKELERVQREKETTQIFKGLEASARKPPSSARRHQASQLSQTQMPPPSLPFKGKQTPQRKDQGPSFRGFKKAFDVSDFPVPESQRARSSSQRNKTTASLSTQVDPFVDATQAFDAPQDVTVEQSTQLLPSQTGPLEPTDQSSGRKSTDISQQIAANMLHSFIIDVNPNPTMSQPDLMVALQFILQSEFKDAAHQATFNRLSLDLFNSLGQSMSSECVNSKDEDDQLIKLVAGIGGIVLELTQLFYHTRLVSLFIKLRL